MGGLLLAVLAALFIARRIAAPVRKLSDTARLFGAGDSSVRASFQSDGELEELRVSFNSMAEEIAKREARLTELDRLKSDFVSGVSHEMRTPLTTIKTLTRVLLRDKTIDGESREFLQTIGAECDRQINLVLNLLDLSRIEAGTFNVSLEPVNVAKVIKSCIETERHNAEARHQLLDLQIPREIPYVLADSSALRRVLCGLIQNAVKYTPDGGRILIETVAVGQEVRIAVSDTGCGIRDEDLPNIFEKFFRGTTPTRGESDSISEDGANGNETPGVGLGLYLARTIVEEIGGHIEVSSEVGIGSRFTIVLPKYDDKT